MSQSQAASVLSKDKLTAPLIQAGEVLVLTDVDNAIIEASENAARLYRCKASGLIGQRLHSLYSHNNPPGIANEIGQGVLESGWQGEMLHVRSDGTEVSVLMTCVPFTDENGAPSLTANFIREVTRDNASGTAMCTLERQLEAMKNVTSAAGQLTNPEELLNTLLAQLLEVSGTEAGAILLHERVDELTVTSSKHVDADFALRFARSTHEQDGVEQGNSPWFVEDTLSECKWMHDAGNGCRSAVRLPLTARHRPVGVLVLLSSRQRAFSEEERELLIAMGREVGILIENSSLFRALQDAYAELQTAYEVSVAISQSIDLDRTLKHVVHSARKALNASNCFLFLLDDERHELVGAATSNQESDFRKLRISMRDTVAGVWVVNEKQPLSIANLSADPRACAFLRDRYGEKSALFVPLTVNDSAIGTLVLDDTERERSFSEAEVRRAQAIANQAALAIQRARLYQEVKEKMQEVTVLYEVGRTLTSTLHPDTVLDEMLHILRESFGYVHCAIMLLEDAGRELYVKASSGYSDERVERLRVKVGHEGITGWVAATGRPLYVPDVEKDPRYIPGMTGVKSEIALPLKIGEKLLGILNVESTEPGAFHERDVRILSSLAAQAAVAIENARLYAEIRRKAEELDAACKDLEVSRENILRANERLREMDRLKSEFLATMSHELRTPLTAIIAYAELMRDERVGEARRAEFLEIVNEQGNRLIQLIDDLLDLSKLECGKIQLALEESDLNDIVLSAVQTIRPTAEKKELRVTTQLSPKLPPVYMDVKRIRQVCWNLLCNAVKFTEKGGKITVVTEDRPEEILVKVVDTGIGIKSDDHERIFDRFAQVDSSATRTHGGAGLGLDLVRRFVTLHSGRVWVESEYGHGSMFQFTLPKERNTPTGRDGRTSTAGSGPAQ